MPSDSGDSSFSTVATSSRVLRSEWRRAQSVSARWASTAMLRSSLNTPDRQPEAAELVRSLVDAIILTPENGTLRLDIDGELAGILALCQVARAKEPGSLSTAELAKQIKLVAGRGFEPLTFRL